MKSRVQAFPCPSCGHGGFDEAPGSGEQCSVCGWVAPEHPVDASATIASDATLTPAPRNAATDDPEATLLLPPRNAATDNPDATLPAALKQAPADDPDATIGRPGSTPPVPGVAVGSPRTAAGAAVRPVSGVRVGGYEELVEVGRGGFAVVYRARHVRLGHQVALKVLARSDLTGEDLRRFEQEGVALGGLSGHPNIVRVHDAGVTEDGSPFLAMEYLAAGSLDDQLVGSGPLGWARAVGYVIEVAGALESAHRSGLLHRDVKPANVLLDEWGNAKLSDFGISAVVGGTETATGHAPLSIAHAAPEVLRGQRASARSDVYSLGSTLFQLLAGSPAFVRSGEDSLAAVVLRAVSEPPPDLRGSGVPADLVAVVEGAMAKDPAGRPASPLALAQLLQGVQRAHGVEVTEPRVLGLTVDVPPLPPPPAPPPVTVAQAAAAAAAARPARPRRTRRMAVITLSIVAVVVVAAFVLIPGDDSRESPAATFDVGAEPGPVAATEQAVWVLGESSGDAEGARLRRVDPRTGQVVATIDVPGAQEVVALEDSVWISGSDVVRSVDASTNRLDVTVDVPDAGVITATEDALWVGSRLDDQITQIDPSSGRVVGTVDIGGRPKALAGAGQVLWALEDNTVVRVDAVTREVTTTVPVSGVVADALAASPEAVWVDNGEELVEIDPASADIVTRLDFGATVLATDDGGVWLTAANHGAAERVAPDDEAVSREVRVSLPRDLALTRDTVWVTSGDGTLSRIDR